MEKIPKIGIIVGIIAVILIMPFLVLMQISFLSHEYGSLFVDQDAIVEKFKTFESYQTFIELYPDYYEKIQNQRSGDVNLEIYAYNFDTGNKLELDIRYNTYDEDVRENVRCRVNDSQYRNYLDTNVSYAMASGDSSFSDSIPSVFFKEGGAEDEFTTDFIKFTNCLEIGIPPESEPQLPIPEPEPFPSSAINSCGPSTSLKDGICVLTLTQNIPNEIISNASIKWDKVQYADEDAGVIRIIDPDMKNLNSEAIDSIDIHVWSDTDAQGIQLRVTETDENTKVFEGTVYFSSIHETSGSRLFVTNGDYVLAQYNDTSIPNNLDAFVEIREHVLVRNEDANLNGIEIHSVNYPSPSKIQFIGTTGNLSDEIQIKVLDNNSTQIKPNVNFSWGLEGFEIIIDSDSSLEPLKDGTYFLVVIQDNPYSEFTTKFTVKGVQ